MAYLIEPLSKKMRMQLEHARAIELSGNICASSDLKRSLGALHKRGLVNTKTITTGRKKIVQVYVTEAGINLLEKYNEDSKTLGSN